MSKTVKIDDELMDAIGSEAKMMSRSLAGQVRHWVRIGMNIERSRFFDQARIVDALNGRLAPDALTAPEQEAYVDGLFDAARSGTAEQDRYFTERRESGLGAGMYRGELTEEAEAAR
ncbi:MAG: hypothetical protein WA908_06055 [Pontixanthobacter sp.]